MRLGNGELFFHAGQQCFLFGPRMVFVCGWTHLSPSSRCSGCRAEVADVAVGGRGGGRAEPPVKSLNPRAARSARPKVLKKSFWRGFHVSE